VEAQLWDADHLDRIDLIVSWPRNCDYPLWRKFLRDNRHRFARVLVVFTDHAGEDISGWVRSVLDATCLDSPPVREDWRDTAVNHALDHSDAEWVWFTEQDFLITDPDRFWTQTVWAEKPLGWQEHDDRWHPSCLFVPRSVIDKTSRYFGTVPVDHFYAFGQEVNAISPIQILQGGFEHLQGTSQNHWLIDSGIDQGVFKRDRFRRYLADCLAADVPLHPGWRDRAIRERERSP
jgi:hypothetical protein